MERAGGIEPPFPGWKPGVLPLYDARNLTIIILIPLGVAVAQRHTAAISAVLIAAYIFRLISYF